MRRLLLFTLPALVLNSILPDSSRSISSPEIDPDAGQNYTEVFSAGGSNSVIYINWLEQATNDFPREPWFRGAYRFFNDGSQIVELERGSSLTNNLRYMLGYSSDGSESLVLFLNLLTTNSIVLAESEDLLTSSNVDHYVYVTTDQGIPATNTVLLVNVPTAEYPEAAVIQIVGRHSPPAALCAALRAGMAATNENGLLLVHEALIFIDEDGDFFTATDEIRNGTSDFIFNASGSVISNYSDWVNGNNGGSSTNNPGGGSGGDGSGEEDNGQQSNGTVWVDQAIGDDDDFTGHAPTVAGRDGPKKTIHRGLAAVEQDGARTLVIKSGAYGEDLDLRGKGVAVVIAGNVRL